MSIFRKMGEFPQNDKKMFNFLYHSYHRIPFGVAFRITHNRQSAEDITQETFERAFEKFEQIKDAEHFIRWLTVTATNLAIDELKKNKNYFFMDEVPEDGSQDNNPEPLFLLEEQKRDILAAINSLRPSYGTVIFLKYFSDLSYEEIAHKLEMNESTVRVRVYRALKELKKRLYRKTPNREGGTTNVL